jgi:hypothetical protein
MLLLKFGYRTISPELLDSLLTRSRELVHSSMQKASSLPLGMLKSLYPKADLGVAGEGFAATCTEAEATALVKSFLETATRIVDMISPAPM